MNIDYPNDKMENVTPNIQIGIVISSDTDNFVRYCKYHKQFAVVKALRLALDDAVDVYEKEINNQTRLSHVGASPKLLRKKVILKKNERLFLGWISEDAGLPIEEDDINATNEFLDSLYDKGIVVSWYIDQHMFVKGFDNKIRVTDCKNVEFYDEPIEKDKRMYIKWIA